LIFALLFFVNTIEKVRKFAEDSQYSSTDEAELGKGFRKHIPAKKYLNTSPSKDTSDDESNEEIATSNCVKNKKTHCHLFHRFLCSTTIILKVKI